MANNENFDLDLQDEDAEDFVVNFGEVTNAGGGGGASDFNDLTNRPKYNSQTMTGNTNIPKVPTKTSELENDGEDGESVYIEADELAPVATSGSYNDLDNKPTIPAAQVQSDWSQSDNSKVDFIKNKPTIPAAQVNSDWNADSGVAQILNKPTIPTVNDATLTITQNGTSKGTFTANDADDTTIEVSDTTYFNFTGTDGVSAGTSGLVPAPATTDADKFLKSDGTWATAGGGGGGDTVYSTKTTSNSSDGGAVYIGPKNASQQVLPDPTTTNKNWRYFWALPFDINGQDNFGTPKDESVNIGGVQTGKQSVSIGYRNKATDADSVVIGWQSSSTGLGNNIVIGNSASTLNSNTVAIGRDSQALANGSAAIGAFSKTTSAGEVNIGSTNSAYGYSSTNYRLLSGVYDGQGAHDAATVGQINATIDAINTALSTNIPHIGA